MPHVPGLGVADWMPVLVQSLQPLLQELGKNSHLSVSTFSIHSEACGQSRENLPSAVLPVLTFFDFNHCAH